MARKTGLVGGFLGRVSSLRPRLDTRTVLEASTLCMALVLAVVFRVLKVRWGPYMDAYDPLFQYRVTEYVVKNGYAAWFTWHDTLSWYPMGRDIAHSSFPGVPFAAAFIYQLLRFFGFNVSVFNVCLYFPVLMGVITCIVVYFLGKDLGGSSVGLFAAIFTAISQAFISRTALGFFDTENIGIFGMAAISLFFLRSTREEGPTWEKVAYAVAAGLCLGLVFASWGASRYVVGLLALFMVASLVTNIYTRDYLVSFGITMGVGMLLGTQVPKLGVEFLFSTDNIMFIAILLVVVVYEAARERIEAGRLLLMAVGLLVVLAAGVYGLGALGVIDP
ncbi:MAG: glycosyltransferase family 39 protein, partial [Candidatus Bathyarchaeota archaeon]|nr:glycosyltransferase family 39 protein [Candidatus Bathyarchaeota archaeon]